MFIFGSGDEGINSTDNIFHGIIKGGFFFSIVYKMVFLCTAGSNPIIGIKPSHVSEFNGKDVGTTSKYIVLVNPNIEEAHTLKAWF